MSSLKVSLFALSLALLVSGTAMAEDLPTPGYPPQEKPAPTAPAADATAVPVEAPAQTAPAAETPAIMPAPASDPTPAPVAEEKKVEKKLGAKKKSMSRADKIKNMSLDERNTLQKELEEWFKSLPLEQQADIQHRAQNIKKKSKHAAKEVKAVEPAKTGEPTVTAPAPAETVPAPMPAPAPETPAMPPAEQAPAH